MSVRALIEEKIIQKRTTKPTATAQTGLTTYPSKEINFSTDNKCTLTFQ